MDRRELLELAAKACGIDTEWSEWRTGHVGKFGEIKYVKHEGFNGWDPLTSDSDALRLAVKLDMYVILGVKENTVSTCATGGVVIEELLGDDPYAATRLAIVKAAAELGKE